MHFFNSLFKKNATRKGVKMGVGLAVMRLQPLHRGHLKVINTMLTNHPKAIIVIGSIENFDDKNPFTFKDRLKMLELVYPQEIKNNKLIIIGAKDIHNPPKWASYIKTLLPIEATCYYSGTGQDAHLFEKEGFKTIQINRDELNISGTMVRNKIKKNENWQKDVPTEIHELIKSKQGVLK